MYIHQRKDWPKFKWDSLAINDLLTSVRHLQGRLLGRMEALGFQSREEATLQVLTQDVIKTSEIEGEKLDNEQVRSSIAKRLGIENKNKVHIDRNVEGIVEILLDATQQFDTPLTKKRLLGWHSALFLSHSNQLYRMKIGKWRNKQSGVMQIVSGPIGREKIHFVAPSYHNIKKEMDAFIKWFNAPSEIDLIIKSAIAHFWFVTIHPFDDGNGRIARAITDMVLARSEKSKQRFYSISSQIQQERSEYYDILEKCQKGSLNITSWIKWFLNCLQHAITASDQILQSILNKAEFWREHSGEPFNERQRSIINRLLDGFYGKLTSSKWAKLMKCSQDTALRDINDLLARNILKKEDGGGRSTSYSIKIE